MTHPRSLLLSFVACLVLTGCSLEEEPAAVKEKSDGAASVVDAGETEPEEDTPEAPSTASLGDLVTIGDWDLKITKVLLNGNDVIKQSNMFNDPAKGQYVLVSYEATYNGTERIADVESDLSWSFTTSDSQVHDEASAVSPADNQGWPTEARQGGTVRGQVVFDLPKALIKGGILTAEGYNAEFDTVFADFTL